MGKIIRAVGIAITLGSIIIGIYLQTTIGNRYGDQATVEHAFIGLFALGAIGIGVLVIAAGHFLMLREAKSN